MSMREKQARLVEKAPESLRELAGHVKAAYRALRYGEKGPDVALAMASLEAAREVLDSAEDFAALGSVSKQWYDSGRVTGDVAIWPPKTERRGG